MEGADIPRIAYAGEPGAFAEDALLVAFGDVARTALSSFRAVFEAVTTGDAAAGVVPIENVIHGTVRENYDLLIEYDLTIRGEVVVPVRLCRGRFLARRNKACDQAIHENGVSADRAGEEDQNQREECERSRRCRRGKACAVR